MATVNKKSQKIIVIGSVDGKFSDLSLKLTAIDSKHGPFDLALCVGNFFPLEETEETRQDYEKIQAQTLKCETRLPHEFYERVYQNHGEISPNLFYLGRKGLLSLSTSGLRIAYLSGVRNSNKENEDSYKRTHVESLARMKTGLPPGVDILLTYEWPDSICTYSPIAESSGIKPQKTAYNASNIAKALNPRYHFSGMERIFYEREAYKNDGGRVTRFIGLGALGNTDKQRWFYALNLVPMVEMEYSALNEVPSFATDSPFGGESSKRQNESYFFGDDSKGNGKRQRYDDDRRKKKDQSCWFCLSNPEIATHLIVSIGTHVYLTIPKGDIVNNHALIIPIDHVPNTRSISTEAKDEITRYIATLKKIFSSLNCELFLWETSFRSNHLNLQVLPIPLDLAAEFEAHFLKHAQSERMEFKSIEEVADEDFLQSYLRVRLPSGKEMVYFPEGRFNLQFCREMLCSLLNTPEKIDWKNCVKSEEEEKKDADEFRKCFEEFEIVETK